MSQDTSIEVGVRAPDFRLPSSRGGETSLADYRGTTKVVLFFVRAYT